MIKGGKRPPATPILDFGIYRHPWRCLLTFSVPAFPEVRSSSKYWADYNMLQSLASAKDQARGLERLVLFLKDISGAWKQADQQQRNRLAQTAV